MENPYFTVKIIIPTRTLIHLENISHIAVWKIGKLYFASHFLVVSDFMKSFYRYKKG